jgi:hypothetical protein
MSSYARQKVGSCMFSQLVFIGTYLANIYLDTYSCLVPMSLEVKYYLIVFNCAFPAWTHHRYFRIRDFNRIGNIRT